MPTLLILFLAWTIAIPAVVIGGLLLAASWRERDATTDVPEVPLLEPGPVPARGVCTSRLRRSRVAARPSRDAGCAPVRPRSISR